MCEKYPQPSDVLDSHQALATRHRRAY